MRKSFTPLALTLPLALTFAATAHADTATSMGDVYQESIWDIHAAAQPSLGKTGPATTGDLYAEAVWDIHAGYSDRLLAEQTAEALGAAKDARPGDPNAIKLNVAE